jgi:hypothetical protein
MWGVITLFIYQLCELAELLYSVVFDQACNRGWKNGITLERLRPWDRNFAWARDKMNKTKAHNEIKSYSIINVSLGNIKLSIFINVLKRLSREPGVQNQECYHVATVSKEKTSYERRTGKWMGERKEALSRLSSRLENCS